MDGSFKESKITVIDLSERRIEDLDSTPITRMLRMFDAVIDQNRAMKTSIALLEKCLDEATEDRDKYRIMWLKNSEARKEYYRLYRNAKRQLDELNARFDEYIKRKKEI